MTNPSLSVDVLNDRFGLAGKLVFTQHADGLVFAEITTALASARISVQGGHVVSWQPASQTKPVLWLSRDAKFLPGKSIRGGVPVCWPWFGPNKAEPTAPAHGFARTASWAVVDSRLLPSGEVSLSLRFTTQAAENKFWPHDSTLDLTVTVGEGLAMQLTTANTGNTSFVLGEALHTYFQISDIGNISVGGLEGNTYWDTVGEVTKREQLGAITFGSETDRVYIDSPNACVIDDAGLGRRISIRKTGSLATVVWSPWTDKANRMGDLGQPDGWREFVCVESANAWDNVLTLGAGESHTLLVDYRVESY